MGGEMVGKELFLVGPYQKAGIQCSAKDAKEDEPWGYSGEPCCRQRAECASPWKDREEARS